MASSQQRCVFVGNIPYDATEEQLKQICEEVGPVVSFRLVIDRETGKPKGYGFCEYKDEETALSARRNLQGYEINGRQLRVDFAENDKNADRSREQGRGGPGMVANAGPQKQLGGPTMLGDSGHHQPVGLQIAMAAASLMAGALGGPQTSKSNQNGLQSQSVLGTDPLTLYLAKMSRNQLNEVMSEIKVVATQNKEQARQLLLASPQLPKSLLQAQIMLGMVTQQMLQMPNIRQASSLFVQPLLEDGQQGQQPAFQTLPGLPPVAPSKVPFGFQVQEGQVPAGHPNSLVHNLYISQLPQQPQNQLLQLAKNQVLQQGSLLAQSGVSTFPSIRPQASVGPQIQVPTSSSIKQQVQRPLLQHPGQVGSANLGHNTQMVSSNATLQRSLLTRPPLSNQGFQPSSSILSGIPDNMSKESGKPPQVYKDLTWVDRVETYTSLPSGLSEKASMVYDSSEPTNRPAKLMKLDDGRDTPFSMADVNLPTSGPSQLFGMSGNQIPKTEVALNSEKQVPQLPPDVESTLLQQVLNLTPEQLNSLPPDQQQQVIQLQQMLRQPS